MKLTKVLDQYSFSQPAKDIFLASGITDLYPPQAEAVKKGLLSGNNLLMSVPTAAGKTLMAELCMIHTIFNDPKARCLYIAPLKALASEKYNDFKKKYASLGIEVGLAIGDMDSPSKYLNRYQIVIATAEKVDSLIRSKAKWLLDHLTTVVLDEIHFINDGSRGPTMEILTARIKLLNPDVQLLALSATVANANEMAGWLGAELVKSTWRPIPLKEGVYFNSQIEFNEHGTRMVMEDAPDDVSKLALDCLRGKGQVLIFVNSRRSAQAVARQVSKSVNSTLTPEEKKQLVELSKKVAGRGGDATKVCHKLAEVVQHGSAFHHAGLKPKQRELIEENFKKNLIKVIGCTPTLAAGVNLPARRAVIRDCKRFEAGLGQAFIPTSEYKQCAGRAGRPQYDEYGEAIMVAKTNSESSTLFERYILAEPEPVTSKLNSPAALRIHILASIAGGYVYDVKGMFEFFSHTFLKYQNLEHDLFSTITDIFDFLHQEKFIEQAGYRFFATPLGALTSRLYIDPFTAIIIRNGIQLLDGRREYSPIGMLHLMACTPDGPFLNIGKKDYNEVETFMAHVHDELILTAENTDMFDDYYRYLSSGKAAWLLTQWIEEEKEDAICEQFNVGPGDVYRHIESTQWLLYAAGRIAELERKKNLTFHIEDLRFRVHYGVREELLNVCRLKGVGRIRARQLFAHGIKTLSDLKFKTLEDIERIPTIGRALARDILQQKMNKTKGSRARQQAAAVESSVESETWSD